MFVLVEDLRRPAVKLDPCACVGLRRRFGLGDRRDGADVVTRARLRCATDDTGRHKCQHHEFETGSPRPGEERETAIESWANRVIYD